MVVPVTHEEDDPSHLMATVLAHRSELMSSGALLPMAMRPPLVAPRTVRREALVSRLQSTRADVVALTAPAGYGKSTLLAQWADSEPDRRFVWVSCCDGAEPSLLLSYFAAALRDVPQVPMFESDSLADICQALAATDTALVIVLDGAERVSDGQCASILGAVADHLTGASQLVVSGRGLPSMPLARLRAENRLLELTAADLALTGTEARSVVACAPDEPSATTAAQLIEMSEGWAAGLSLALAAQCNSRGSSYVADYLRSEWLGELPVTDRRVVMQTAVTESVSRDIGEAPAERSHVAHTLNELSQQGGFVVAEEGHGVRYHPMVRQFLLAELDREDPQVLARLRRRAAVWYSGRGDTELAVDMAFAAGDPDLAAELASAGAPTLYQAGAAHAVEGWLDRLAGSPAIQTHSPLVVLATWVHAVGGRLSDAQRWARTVEQTTDVESRASKLIVRALTCRQGIVHMHRDAAAALELTLPTSDLFPLGATLLGWSQLLAGDHEAADRAFQDAVEAALGRSFLELAALGSTGRALCALERQRWELADGFCQDALAIVGDGPLAVYGPGAITHAVAGRIASRLGEHAHALQHADRAMELMAGLTPAIPWLSVHTHCETARLQLALGRPDIALALCDDVQMLSRTCPALGYQPTTELKLQALFLSRRDPWAATLTRAELRLLPYLTTHLSYGAMAKELFVSRNTVKSQMISIYRKLGVSSRAEAVTRLADLGLVSASPAG